MRLSQQNHEQVTAAVTEAERGTNGEIVTITAARSDRYHDVALHWAVLIMLLPMTIFAVRPDWLLHLLGVVLDGWQREPNLHEIVTALLLSTTLAFLLSLLVLRKETLRVALTPPATKTRRVRARAVDLFRAGTERRTRGRTGVLIYLSLAERRAEIVADAAIHAKVAPDTWGEAMDALLGHVRTGQVGEGLAAAVTQVGAVLAEHFPRTAGDTDELPDRVIEL